MKRRKSFVAKAEGCKGASKEAKSIFAPSDEVEHVDPFVVAWVAFDIVQDQGNAVAVAVRGFKADSRTSSWRDVSERAVRASVDK